MYGRVLRKRNLFWRIARSEARSLDMVSSVSILSFVFVTYETNGCDVNFVTRRIYVGIVRSKRRSSLFQIRRHSQNCVAFAVD